YLPLYTCPTRRSSDLFFDKRFVEPISVFRMIHYPPRATASSAEQQGAGAHTDYGCITLLHQDQAGGLQVQNVKGEWIDAPPIERSEEHTSELQSRENL